MLSDKYYLALTHSVRINVKLVNFCKPKNIFNYRRENQAQYPYI